METKRPKEYQTIRLFAILALLTCIFILVFKVVLFAPNSMDRIRVPAQNNSGLLTEPDVNPSGSEKKLFLGE